MPTDTVLIPVVFPDPEITPLHDSFVRELRGFEVTLFGYWEVEDGESLDEARDAHETAAEATLYDLASQFSREGIPTDVQLQFGRAGEEEREFREHIADQIHASAILLSESSTLLRRVLVAIRDEDDGAQLTELTGALDPETTLRVELYHAAESDGAVTHAEEFLAGMRETLHEQGFSDVDLTTTVEVTDDPAFSIAQRARDYELVVLGETAQLDIEDRVFGETYEYIAEQTDVPILLGRRNDDA